MDYRNLEKLLRTVDLLAREGGVTISGLERVLGVSRRSVYRMFELPGEFNFPIYDGKRTLMHSELGKKIDALVSKLSIFGGETAGGNAFPKSSIRYS